MFTVVTGEQAKAFRTKVLRQTQEEMATALGVSRSFYANFERGYTALGSAAATILESKIAQANALAMLGGLAHRPTTEIKYVGLLCADAEVNWAEFSDTDATVTVPTDMVADDSSFAGRIETDSMTPLLQPDDIVVFKSSSIPRINLVVLYKSSDLRLTVKQLKHDGESFYLHALNPRYEDVRVGNGGRVIGHLVGVVRQIGLRFITDFDPEGIKP